uniref:Uncharacterized protein n=1 Tax=Opuntia streptacantha TaxID=393608 RepID=A0A7C9A0F5_OPUST
MWHKLNHLVIERVFPLKTLTLEMDICQVAKCIALQTMEEVLQHLKSHLSMNKQVRVLMAIMNLMGFRASVMVSLALKTFLLLKNFCSPIITVIWNLSSSTLLLISIVQRL